MLTGLNSDRVLQALEILLQQVRGAPRRLRTVADYTMPNVSDKVVRIILSYTDYVHRVVLLAEGYRLLYWPEGSPYPWT